jgi:hypothetical protein
MDKVLKPTDSECYTPSSEPIRFYMLTYLFHKQYTYEIQMLWYKDLQYVIWLDHLEYERMIEEGYAE